MLKTYYTKYTLTINGEEYITNTRRPIILNEKDVAIKEFSGKTFQSFCEMFPNYGLIIPGNSWMRGIFSKKRRIEFFNTYCNFKTWIDNGEEREWSFKIEDIECEVSMNQLLECKSDLVIEYLKERGINKI